MVKNPLQIPFNKYYRLLYTYLKPFKYQVAGLTLLMLTQISLQIINPQIIRYYIDQVTQTNNIQTLTNAAILYIIISVLSQLLVIGMAYLSQSVSWGSTNLLRSELLDKTMRLDMTFHNQYKPGDMIERVDGDVNALSNFFSQMVIQVLSNILLIIGILVALFFEGLIIGLVFTVFTLTGLILSYNARKIAVPYFKKNREASMKLFGYIEERIAGTEDIRSLGARPNAMKKFYGVEKDRYNAMIKAITVSRLISVVFTGLIGFGITLVFILGIPLFNAGSITLGTIFLMNYYVQQLVYPIFEILRQLQTLQQADASIERIEEILDMDSEIENNGMKKLEGPVRVTFKDVNFAYFEDQKVLQSISFELTPGEQLGLIGRTGSGKTTISRLLYRLYNIGDGEILLNGIRLQDYELSQLRRSIGLVSQDVQLFNTTLRNNITFFDSSIPDEKLKDIIEKLDLKSWFNQLPKGFDTRISADDVSAGQAQLIALSRIFLEDPALIILDEASSRLDPATEKILSQALEKIMLNKTAIIIAHRLSTLNSVDKILELSHGEILEYGFREELRQNPQSSYAKLVRTGEEVLFA